MTKKLPLLSVVSEFEDRIADEKFEIIEKLINDSFNDTQSGDYFDTADLLKININDLLNPEKEKSDLEMKAISCGKDLAIAFNVPEKNFYPIMLMFIFSLINGRKYEARAIFNAILTTSIQVMTLEKGPERIGVLGGRPEHERKGEAISLAMQLLEQNPKASKNSVANFVKAKMDEKHTDAPKLPTIKVWIKDLAQRSEHL
ncbi:hypothetical protein [Rahnella sp. ChDrAdgB13]|uniref:hypothetical protein n=1 Tax=Rahnella sp. ChDrAdgB13 TaxID=1850581 RepID=UPI001AD86794|nr:hypothetical protein [Rahnella sp. ChDrAdgB13]